LIATPKAKTMGASPPFGSFVAMRAGLLILPLLLIAAAPGQSQAPMAAETDSLQLACDALNIAGQLNNATLRELGPAHSLDAAAAVLERNKVKFTRHRNVMMLSDAPSAMIREIFQLPQGEPIVLPNGDDTTICVPVPHEDSV
jgi:hypothetical protein